MRFVLLQNKLNRAFSLTWPASMQIYWNKRNRFRGGSRGRVQGGAHPPPPPEMTCGFLIQLVFCQKKTMWFIVVEVEQETSAPPLKKNLGSAPAFA